MNAIYKHQINICITFGLIGFLCSVLLLTCHNKGDDGKRSINSPYGEIVVSNKDSLVNYIFRRRIEKLQKEMDKHRKVDLASPQNAAIKKFMEEAKRVVENTQIERNAFRYGTAGIELKNYTKYIFPVNKKDFLAALDSSAWRNNNNFSIKIPAILIDDCKLLPDYPARYAQQHLELKQHKRLQLLNFIDDYPQFGLWIVLSIIQMTLWFLLFPLLTGNVLNLKPKLPSANGINIGGILKNLFLPVIAILVFCYCFYIRLADGYVINDNHFFQNYNTRLLYYAIAGYLVSAYCFATYIFLARQIDLLNQNFISPGLLSLNTINSGYLVLKKAFDSAFLASALILSLMVIWVGVTINAVNSTESMFFLGLIKGKSVIANDLTFLMGLLHTCLLLIFYLPVKLKFDSLEITQPPSPGGHLKTVFSSLAESLKTLLITASPVLAGFVQEIFTAFLKT